MENKKMIATAQKLDVLFKILQVIVLVGLIASCIIMAVLTAVNHVNPQALEGTVNYTVSMGPASVKIVPEQAPDFGSVLSLGWVAFALSGTAALAFWFCLKFIRNILEPMKQGTPFRSEAVQNFRKLAWVVMITGIIRNIVNFAGTAIAMERWNLTGLTNVPGIQSVQVSTDFELGFLVVFFGILLMSYIFEYGVSLQQLSDETL